MQFRSTWVVLETPKESLQGFDLPACIMHSDFSQEAQGFANLMRHTNPNPKAKDFNYTAKELDETNICPACGKYVKPAEKYW